MDVIFDRGESGLCRVAVAGDMTIYAALALKDKLLLPLAQCKAVEIDLAGVSEIDSAGLQLLIVARNEARARGKTLTITGHSQTVLDMLAQCNLQGLFGGNALIPAGA